VEIIGLSYESTINRFTELHNVGEITTRIDLVTWFLTTFENAIYAPVNAKPAPGVLKPAGFF